MSNLVRALAVAVSAFRAARREADGGGQVSLALEDQSGALSFQAPARSFDEAWREATAKPAVPFERLYGVHVLQPNPDDPLLQMYLRERETWR